MRAPKPKSARTRRIKYATVFSTNLQKEMPLCGVVGLRVPPDGDEVGEMVGAWLMGTTGAAVGGVVPATVGFAVFRGVVGLSVCTVTFVGDTVGAAVVRLAGVVGAAVAFESMVVGAGESFKSSSLRWTALSAGGSAAKLRVALNKKTHRVRMSRLGLPALVWEPVI
jgi:hypothetical protein